MFSSSHGAKRCASVRNSSAYYMLELSKFPLHLYRCPALQGRLLYPKTQGGTDDIALVVHVGYLVPGLHAQCKF
jgi:hypothetical protein